MSCVEVHVFKVCGKDAVRLMRKEIKDNRRKRLLLKLIKERRAMRNKNG